MYRFTRFLWLFTPLLATTCGEEKAMHAAAQPAPAIPSRVRYLDPSWAIPSDTMIAARNNTVDRSQHDISPDEQRIFRWIEGSDEALRTLAQGDHAIAPLARLRLAKRILDRLLAEPEAEVEQEILAGAMALLEDLPEDFRHEQRAQLQALALFLSANANPTQRDDAITALRERVDATPAHIGAAASAMPLAELLLTKARAATEAEAEAEAEAEDGADSASAEQTPVRTEQIEEPVAVAQRLRTEAVMLYDRVATRAPRTEVGERAAEAARQLRRRHDSLPRRSVADRIARAEAIGRGQPEAGERAYSVLLRSISPDNSKRCDVLFAEADAVLRQRDRVRGGPMMANVAERCAGDLQARARYKAARAFTQLNERRRARANYYALLEEAPQHRLADDALYRLALLAPNDEGERGFFNRLVTEYPNGDMRGEALFRLGMEARERDAFEEALDYFSQGCDVGEDREDLYGRAAYWHGRTLADLGREDVSAYESLARRFPLSFYGQLALERIRLKDVAAYAAIRTRALGASDETPSPLRFRWREEFASDAMDRALLLLRAGDIDEANVELSRLGLIGAAAEASDRWIGAALLNAAGALKESTRLFRRAVTSFRRMAPSGDGRQRWRLAYPRAFSPMIEERSNDASVPPSLARAIAREESGFDPNAVSWAHAYGLVQVLIPTARRYGRDLGIRINARTLREPDTNLAVGTRFMGWLRRRYNDTRFIPPAYNAGHGNLDRWLRRTGDLPFDEFVEAIPYDETRRYTRRVLQSYGVYAWLDEGRLPELLKAAD